MRRIKVYGAGSIGNHLAHAARTMGWEVTICDTDPDALQRARTQIYPGRYGEWDASIHLTLNEDAPRGDFDVIHIGTPPASHIPLALEALEESPGLVLVEKPLCPPAMEGVDDLVASSGARGIPVLVGYDHVVSAAARTAEELLADGVVGDVLSLDVDFREHWGGIFGAHPWLDGPADTYLGFTAQGGGASCEHSHALNLWQHFAQLMRAGPIAQVEATLDWQEEGGALYDRMCFFNLRTEGGLTGRVAQDLVTVPAKKVARVQGSEGQLEWVAGYDETGDAVIVRQADGSEEIRAIPKTRPDDFIEELRHVEAVLAGEVKESPISLARGLATMEVISTALRQDAARRGT